ncbi:MAG: DMT family transporter [Roseburia sp.]|nr:DMT family transporter [Roseburia sp.]
MEKKRQSRKSVLCVLAAGMLWGCMGILVRTMKEGGFDSLEVTAFRSFVTTVLMFGGMFLFKREELKIRGRDIWCFVGTGVLSITFFNVCYFSCMNHTTLSVAAILLYTAPSFVMVLSALLFREKLTPRKLLALGLAFAGCVLVSGGFDGTGIGMAGLLTGLGAGFGYALYSIFGRYALQKGYSSYTITSYTFLFALLGTMPFMDAGHFVKCMRMGAGILPFATFMAIVTTVAAYLLYTAGLKGLENSKASIIASVEPVMASAVGFLLYKEAMPPLGAAGMILVLLSCFLVA